MPTVTPLDRLYLHIGTLKQVGIAGLSVNNSRYPFPVGEMMRLVISERLNLAGEHLRTGDTLLLAGHFRSSISRHYYAMYHSARAIVFAVEKGDDYERHIELPRHLPSALVDAGSWEVRLTDARLLRNQADYDPYPSGNSDWEVDARGLGSTAAKFLAECEEFVLENGHV